MAPNALALRVAALVIVVNVADSGDFCVTGSAFLGVWLPPVSWEIRKCLIDRGRFRDDAILNGVGGFSKICTKTSTHVQISKHDASEPQRRIPRHSQAPERRNIETRPAYDVGHFQGPYR